MPDPGPRSSDPREQPWAWTILPAGLSLDIGDSVMFDMLFVDSIFRTGTAERVERPVRGYRYRLKPIRKPAERGVYGAKCELEARFNLPPGLKAFCPEGGQLPGRRGSASIYGSTLFVHSNGGIVHPGSDRPHALHYLYSLPNRWPDVQHSPNAAECTTESPKDNPQLSGKVVVDVGLTCLWEGPLSEPRHICTASGRFFVVEGNARNLSYRVYDFLRPWNHSDDL